MKRKNKRPTKAKLSEAGRKLRNPHTPEKKEPKYAKILAAGKKRKRNKNHRDKIPGRPTDTYEVSVDKLGLNLLR